MSVAAQKHLLAEARVTDYIIVVRIKNTTVGDFTLGVRSSEWSKPQALEGNAR
jgi:hypothetical protein